MKKYLKKYDDNNDEDDGDYNIYTGHRKDCYWKSDPNDNKNGKAAKCDALKRNGKECGAYVCRHSCLKMHRGKLRGKCHRHYIRKCNRNNNWTNKLSQCANKKCDDLKVNLKARKNISNDDVNDVLEIKGKFSYNHVASDSRKRVIRPVNSNNNKCNNFIGFTDSDVDDSDGDYVERRSRKNNNVGKRGRKNNNVDVSNKKQKVDNNNEITIIEISSDDEEIM